MFINDIPLPQIGLPELQRLIDEQPREDKQLEYKESLNLKDEKREFLADVAAMANTSGGDIIFGISEQRDANNRPTGIPDQIVGVDIDNWDKWQLRLSEAIRDNIEPRIQGIEMSAIAVENGRTVFIIRIPTSLRTPHMIKSPPPFFYRTLAGKSPMDLTEIQQSLLRSTNIRERANLFRRERISLVADGGAPVNLPSTAKTFIHLVPLGTQPFTLNFNDVSVKTALQSLFPLGFPGGGYNVFINFDGRVHADQTQHGTVASYVQVFRDASMEFCDTLLLQPINEQNGVQRYSIDTPEYEQLIMKTLRGAINVYATLNIHVPIVVFISLVGVRNYVINYTKQGSFPLRSGVRPIDRDDLFLPAQMLESAGEQLEPVMKPVFDMIWNAAGLARSLAYDENGGWSDR